MSTISSRRFFIVAVLLVTGVAGALLRSFSSPQSTPYYVGTMLMVMWVPVVGNIISFLVNRLSPAAPVRPSFSSAMPFVPQVVVKLVLSLAPGQGLAMNESDGKHHCLFITGTEGFSARVSPLETEIAGEALCAEVQFLLPAAALPKFPIGRTFEMKQGGRVVGTGQVLSLSPSTEPISESSRADKLGGTSPLTP
jgi:hypothetical protein